MKKKEILDLYTKRYNFLQEAAKDLKSDLTNTFDNIPRTEIHIDRIDTRAKGIDRFVDKALKEKDGKLKYQNPINEIQDQIGARILVLYLKDVENVGNRIHDYYTNFEDINKEPDNDHEFKYFGRHMILTMPQEIRDKYGKENIPVVFELQIKTLFQYAWSECEHDLNYKHIEGGELGKEEQRLLALSSAQSWGSDKIFDELLSKIQK
ncbi:MULTISPECIES: GTP pyrophosphokinase [unclassified Treponema]|uniref:GTP pyrophosphokinase n=1 Tax=unclassified Treponema TaxID=2638727 RepID=UPI000E851236|nr:MULTISPECIES: RelA/SpoT domain-containing protein [unclassified Treponema]HBP09150.1 hypothetical protein [Treponema sp.]